MGTDGIRVGFASVTRGAQFSTLFPGESDWYFTVQFLSLVPLFVLMPLKLRETGPDGRRRFGWVVAGIVLGFLPIASIPSRLRCGPDTQHCRSAACVQNHDGRGDARAADRRIRRTCAALLLSLVVRRVLQYVFSRSVIGIVAALPLAALVALIVFNRDRPISDLATGNLGLGLVAIAVAGVAAVAGRRRLLLALDRQFFRQQVDAEATLLAVSDAVHRADSVDTLRETLCAAVDTAFHLTRSSRSLPAMITACTRLMLIFRRCRAPAGLRGSWRRPVRRWQSSRRMRCCSIA